MVEKRLSAHPEEFGQGAIEGVAGPEAANNAAAAGVLVPLLTLGLPSSATAAVLLTAFQQYGLQPGPLLFSTRPDLVWTLIASLYIGNVMLLVLNLPLAPLWARVMLVPRSLLFGGILVLASVGAYSLNRSLLDLVLLYAVGAVGCAMRVVRHAAGAGGARPHPRPARRAAVPARAGHQPAAISRSSSRGRSARRLLVVRGAVLVVPMLLRAPAAGGRGDMTDRRLRRRRARRRQRRPVRGADGARSGRERHRPRIARRGISAAATAATRATCGRRIATPTAVLHRRLPRRRVPGGSRSASAARTPTRRWRGWSSAARPSCPEWMQRHGVRFQSSLQGTLHLGRTNAFFLGGGKALMNSYYAAAERLGIDVRLRRRGRRASISPTAGSRPHIVRTARAARRRCARRAAVLAAGGFESNLEWLREAWGQRRRQLHHPRHAVQQGRAPQADARRRRAAGRRPARLPCGRGRCPRAEVRRRHRHPARLRAARHRVNAARAALLRRGRRLLAEALRDLGQPRRAAAGSDRVLDHRRRRRSAASCRRCFRRIARRLDPRARGDARSAGGRAGSNRRAPSTPRCVPARFDHAVLDDCRTEGLEPAEKSHWAQPLDTPPFWALSAAARHHVHVSRPEVSIARARVADGRRRSGRTTSTPRARSWRATSCAGATSPASA